MNDYTCPTCGAMFERVYRHCEECGGHYRGDHTDCPGPIDWAMRREKAKAFTRQELKKGHRWADKPY